MYNHVGIQGRFVADPELKHTLNSTAVTSFSLASNRIKSNGEQDVTYIDCVAWRGTADFICKYFSKGDMVLVSGSLISRSYTDKNGTKHKVTELLVNSVDFCGKKATPGEVPKKADKIEEMAEEEAVDELLIEDSDLPF